MEIREAKPVDVPAVSVLAARTFPLACPPYMPQADIDRFIAEELNEAAISEWMAQTRYRLTVGEASGEIAGYFLLVDEGDVQFVSKCYVAPEYQGTGLAAQMMNEAAEFASSAGAQALRLGVSRANKRALAFYTKQGFTLVGEREFTVGTQLEIDDVLELELPTP